MTEINLRYMEMKEELIIEKNIVSKELDKYEVNNDTLNKSIKKKLYLEEFDPNYEYTYKTVDMGFAGATVELVKKIKSKNIKLDI